MLTKRIIPCLDIKDGRVVKGTNFLELRDAGDPVELSKIYNEQGADELVFLDIGASYEKRDIIEHLVEKTADQVFIPLTVGGGIRTTDDFRRILRAGADKISVNTAAIHNPDLIKQSSELYGAQCVVVAIDSKRHYVNEEELDSKQLKDKNVVKVDKNKYCWFEVFIYGGRKETGIDAIEWAKTAEELGAGEILLTSMDADGTKDGYDIELTKSISTHTKLPIIASGGCGGPQHIHQVFKYGKADAALMASILHYREYTVEDLKKYCMDKNIPMRL